ncbi:MAG: ABC transporter substrate binding protein [Thiotrichaceae bacterium]|nr:ABC transporter substrate binding protein [Thiotrichaceae bacterium]
MNLNKLGQWACIILWSLHAPSHAADSLQGKKVLHIDSYEESYEWSRSLKRSIDEVFLNTGVTVTRFYFDAKRRTTAAEKAEIALQAKALIEKLHPDVVIASDDEVSKNLIMPFYKNASLPFVFCGINWDAKQYGFPYDNVTGMLEVDLAVNIVKQLREYAQGDRVGFISLDGFSEVKTADYYHKHLNMNLQKTYFVKTFAEWKNAFKQAQQEVDILLISNPKGISDWDMLEAVKFVEQHTKIPTGATHRWLSPLALLSIVKLPEEQGKWAAETALKILHGAKPLDFPITRNREGKLILNLHVALALGITFKPALLKVGGTDILH